MAKKTELIVMMEDYNGYKNVLFLSDTESLEKRKSYGLPDLIHVTGGKRVKVEKIFQRKPYVFQGENGKTYSIFSDWSAKEVTKIILQS